MFKRELKCNFKNFMIWTIIILVLFVVVFAIYPSIASSDNIKSIDELNIFNSLFKLCDKILV